MSEHINDRKMKDSGIEWVGRIPDNWETVKISGLYSLRNTKVSDTDYPPLSVTMQGILPQLDSAAKTNDHDNRKLVKKGDFAINSRSDRRGSCGISDYDGSVSLINTVLKPNRTMVNEFYNWLFHTPQFSDEFYKWGHGIVDDLWTTNWQDMKKITVPFPSLEEQERIAAFLNFKCAEIDALRSDIEKEIETLEEFKKSVITEAVTKGLDPNAPMKDSGVAWIGAIPDDWELINIKRVYDRTHPYPIGDGDHGMVSPTDYMDEGIPYIRVQNLGFCTELITDNIVYIAPEVNRRIKGSTLRPNDVLVVKTGATIGKTGIVPTNMPIANTTSHVGKITVSKEFNPRFVYYVLSSFVGYKQFWDIASQKSTRPELSIDEIKRLFLIMPKQRKEQDLIVTVLDNKCARIDEAIMIKDKQLSVVNEYKKSFIYEYVTGKKEVPSHE